MTHDSSDSGQKNLPNNRKRVTPNKQSSDFDSAQSLELRQKLAAQKIAELKKSEQLRTSTNSISRKSSTPQTLSKNSPKSSTDTAGSVFGEGVSIGANGNPNALEHSTVLANLANLANLVNLANLPSLVS